MSSELISVGDVSVKVKYPFEELWLLRYFEKSYDVDAQASVNLYRIKDDVEAIQPPIFNNGTLELSVGFFDGEIVDMMHIWRHIAYVSGRASQTFTYAHGAGLVHNNSGLLLAGPSGSGKSTLSHKLDGQLLDDDMILFSNDEIRRVAKFGGEREEGNSYVHLMKDGVESSSLDYVFLLDKNSPSGLVKPVNPLDIDPRYFFDTQLSQELYFDYVKQFPLNLHAPVYTLGTGGEVERTLAAIRDVVR